MANMYKSTLESGGLTPTGNATSADVLSGKTFMNSSGAQTGSMTNNGAVSGTATPTQPYTIPEGYHNGQGQVTASGGQCAIGNVALSTDSSTHVNLGFKPKFVYASLAVNATTLNAICIYDERYSTSKCNRATNTAGNTDYNIPSTSTNRIVSIDNDGFTLGEYTSNLSNCYYVAVG